MKARGLHAGAMFIALVFAQACSNASGQAARGPRQPQVVPGETTTVRRMSVQRTVDLAGTLMSPDQAKISSEVAGVIRDVAVQLGQAVRRGQVLVHVEPTELELAFERAQSALKQTEAQLGMTNDTDPPPPDDQVSAV